METRIAESIRESPFLVGDIIGWPAKLYPNKIAIQWDDGSLTYSQLNTRVHERSACLRRAGVSRFQRWGLLYANGSEFVISLLALLRAGAVGVPLGVRDPAPRIRILAAKARLDGILFETRRDETFPLTEVFTESRAFKIDEETQGCTQRDFDREERESHRGVDLDPALILFTSGSTGATRGVVLQHHAILANMRSNICELGYQDWDRTLVVLPMVHAYALIHQALAHLMTGATVHFPAAPIVPPALWHRLQRAQISTLTIAPPWVPLLIEALRGRKPLSHFRLLSIGAGATRTDLLSDLIPLIPATTIALTYGLTEAGPRVSTLFPKRSDSSPRSIGAPLPNVEIRLAGSKGKSGEVLVRSRSVSQRFAEELCVEGEDGIVRTGDLARNGAGGLVLEGRLRRTVNRGGCLVSPQDVEDVLRGHHAVQDALVKGEADAVLGEAPIAIISPRPGAAIDLAELRDYCAARLPAEQRPARFVIVEALDATAGKRDLLTSLAGGCSQR